MSQTDRQTDRQITVALYSQARVNGQLIIGGANWLYEALHMLKKAGHANYNRVGNVEKIDFIQLLKGFKASTKFKVVNFSAALYPGCTYMYM